MCVQCVNTLLKAAIARFQRCACCARLFWRSTQPTVSSRRWVGRWDRRIGFNNPQGDLKIGICRVKLSSKNGSVWIHQITSNLIYIFRCVYPCTVSFQAKMQSTIMNSCIQEGSQSEFGDFEALKNLMETKPDSSETEDMVPWPLAKFIIPVTREAGFSCLVTGCWRWLQICFACELFRPSS